jgi:DNA-binding transcriptional MocR family regulator
MINHESRTLILRNGVEITVEAGQMFTSYDSLADRWHWSRNRVRRFLDQLSAHQMITRTGTPSGTLITANSWALYQFGGTPTNKPTDKPTDKRTDKRTDHEQEYIRTNINKNVEEEKASPSDSSRSRNYE